MTSRVRVAVVTFGVATLFTTVGLLIHGGVYGWTLFCTSPVIVGVLSAALFPPDTSWIAAKTGALGASLCTVALLIFGIEGAICIVMALPLVAPLGALGGWLYFCADTRLVQRHSSAFLLLLPLATLTFDMNAKPRLYPVTSQVTIAATPEKVWTHVVEFSPLPEPDQWYFRAGVAYPKRARIEGLGPGAVRYCEFSTGTFVEPIEVWEAPHLLHFRVDHTPAPLHELTPYGTIEPKHLHGYLISKQGEFRLTRLPDGSTLLQGTTWYQHGLWPAEYWRWWSDAIIHRIHMRVLNHVRDLSELDARSHMLNAAPSH